MKAAGLAALAWALAEHAVPGLGLGLGVRAEPAVPSVPVSGEMARALLCCVTFARGNRAAPLPRGLRRRRLPARGGQAATRRPSGLAPPRSDAAPLNVAIPAGTVGPCPSAALTRATDEAARPRQGAPPSSPAFASPRSAGCSRVRSRSRRVAGTWASQRPDDSSGGNRGREAPLWREGGAALPWLLIG